jgi:hypothetical protein
MQDMQEMQEMQDMQGHHLSDVSEANIEADAVKQLDNELLIFAHLFEGLPSHGSNRDKFEFFQTWMQQNLSVHRYHRWVVEGSFKKIPAYNLDDRYYFAYAYLATLAIGYVVYASIVDPTGIVKFDQQFEAFSKFLRLREGDWLVCMFLEYGEYQRTNMIKGLLLEIEKISGDTVLTFMGTTILGDASKVGALLQQWSAESIHDVVVGSWGGHNLNWKVDAAVMVSMFEGLTQSTRESRVLDHFEHWAHQLPHSHKWTLRPKTFDVYKGLGSLQSHTITESEHFVLALPRLYLLSILYVVYASAFASPGGDQEPSRILYKLGKVVNKLDPGSVMPGDTLVTCTSLIRRIMSRRLADTGARACNALINKLVKKYPDNRTPLTYAGRAIGTVGTVTSVLHQLKAHCLKGDTRKSLPTIYHIAKAALVQQTGGGDDATIVSESGIDTDADAMMIGRRLPTSKKRLSTRPDTTR